MMMPKRRWWIYGLVVVAAGVVVFVAFLRSSNGQSKSGPKGKDAQNRSVPVVVATVGKKDVGVYVTGLGTVTSVNTVTVRTRVDGQILDVAYREGEHVRAGDRLFTIDPRPFQVQLTQAEGQKGKDQAALENAQVTLARDKNLVDQDLIPRQDYDNQAALVKQLEAAVRGDQGLIDAAQLNLTYCRITAPIGGKAGLKLVDQGNIVHPTDANGLVVITQMEPITVIFTIAGDRLPQVLEQTRNDRHLSVEAYDREMKKRLAVGSLQAIDNQIDPTTGTVRLKAAFANEDGALFPNQFVNARLLVDTLRQATVVPTAAIQRSPDGAFVYVVKADQTIDDRTVEPQLTEGDDTVLRGGVAPGEQVVVEGTDRLRPGVKVTPSQAAAGPRT